MPLLRLQGKWFVFIPITVWLGALSGTLPQYYEVGSDVLYLRQGWRKIRIPWASLVQLHSYSDSQSAGVFSTDRILVVTTQGKRYLIAVAEEEHFLDAVLASCPNLQRTAFGLGLPLAPPEYP